VVGGLTYVFFKILSALKLLRTSAADELNGLDIPEMGALGYPPDWEPASDALIPSEKAKLARKAAPAD
jgi:hypothetical protein